MEERTPTCPKCRCVMEDGFVVDVTHGAFAQSRWIDGEPKKSYWFGLQVNYKAGHPITTYRCTGCGFLESYCPGASQTLIRPAKSAPTSNEDRLLRPSSPESSE